MIICPNCKAEHPDDANFCDQCGEDLVINCPACGATARPTAKFCPKCRNRLNGNASEEKIFKDNVIAGDVNASTSTTIVTNNYGPSFTDFDDARCSECGEIIPGRLKIYNKCKDCGEYFCNKHLKNQICQSCEKERFLTPFVFEKRANNKYAIIRLKNIHEISVDIPSFVESIEDGAFEGSDLIQVTFHDGLVKIGNRAFANCKDMGDISFPTSLCVIGAEAFYGCSNLSAEVRSGVRIGANAFHGTINDDLQEKKRKEEARRIEEAEKRRKVEESRKAEEARKVSESLWGTSSNTTQNNNTIVCTACGGQNNSAKLYCSYCGSKITIPSQKPVEHSTSDGCDVWLTNTGPKKLDVIQTIRQITSLGLKEASDLTSKSPSLIVKGASIGRATVVKAMLEYAGAKAEIKGLEQAQEKVDEARQNRLAEVQRKAEEARRLRETEEKRKSEEERRQQEYEQFTQPFEYTDARRTIKKVKDKTIRTAEIPDFVSKIDDSAFGDCKSLRSITIPNSVTSIGDSAFHTCLNLRSITIGNGVRSIGESAFSVCSSLTSITIPDGVKSIGSNTFYNCRSLMSVTIPNSVTSIGYQAFSGCFSLASITIPARVRSIGWNTFYNCRSLTSITFEGTVAEWNAITFGKDWNYNILTKKVICSNGTVQLS